MPPLRATVTPGVRASASSTERKAWTSVRVSTVTAWPVSSTGCSVPDAVTTISASCVVSGRLSSDWADAATQKRLDAGHRAPASRSVVRNFTKLSFRMTYQNAVTRRKALVPPGAPRPAEKTAATGRSPDFRVIADRPTFPAPERQWHIGTIARRSQLRGQRRVWDYPAPASLFVPPRSGNPWPGRADSRSAMTRQRPFHLPNGGLCRPPRTGKQE